MSEFYEVEKELAGLGFDLQAQRAKAEAFLDALERGDDLLATIPKHSDKMPTMPENKNGKRR